MSTERRRNPYDLSLSSRARRKLTDVLPSAVAFAVYEFITGPLLENPHRVGKPLLRELAGEYSARRAEYRVIYSIDEDKHMVHVTEIEHRRGAYRPR